MTENLDTPQLSQLFHAYLDEEVVTSERNNSAFANDVYHLTDSSGQEYVMRVLKAQSPETVNFEAVMQERLAEKGIGTPRYLQLADGSCVGEYDGQSFTLS